MTFWRRLSTGRRFDNNKKPPFGGTIFLYRTIIYWKLKEIQRYNYEEIKKYRKGNVRKKD